MDWAIRDAAPEDLPGILSIYNDVLATSTAVYNETPDTLAGREAWWRARRAAGYPVLVAREIDGAVAGFGSFGDFRAWPGYRYTVEHTVHVRADCRGQGMGAALVLALVEQATRLGKHAMVGGIDAENAGSIRLHERLGFERVAHLRQVGCKFGRWLDLVFVERLLNSNAPPT